MIFIYFLFIYLFFVFYFNYKYPEVRWKWNNIDASKVSFPKHFFWGTATAAHQIEGDNKNNNWSLWEKQKNNKGKTGIKDGQISGTACDQWNRYKDDISLLKNLNVSHYRISIEWSKIEPEKGIYNKSAINHYSNVIDSLKKENITPVITLHHFTNPVWFDKMGGFEKEKNILHFVSFCKKVFLEYSDRVKLWCTINEPEVYAIMGYFEGSFPPGKKDPQATVNIIKHLLIAHRKAYNSLKALPRGKESNIGIVKNIMQFDPYRKWHLLDWFACRITNLIFNDFIISFFVKGKIKFNIPFFAKINYNPKGEDIKTDFFGLNYYSHIHLKFVFDKNRFFENKFLKKDIRTDMPYSIYPEGFYRAIKKASKIKKPIIITENGIADKKDDKRALFIERYIYAMNKAMKEGADIRGYFYWTLMDNFEWAEGYDMKFGLYEVNFKTQERKLREGSKKLIQIINDHKNKYI